MNLQKKMIAILCHCQWFWILQLQTIRYRITDQRTIVNVTFVVIQIIDRIKRDEWFYLLNTSLYDGLWILIAGLILNFTAAGREIQIADQQFNVLLLWADRCIQCLDEFYTFFSPSLMGKHENDTNTNIVQFVYIEEKNIHSMSTL